MTVLDSILGTGLRVLNDKKNIPREVANPATPSPLVLEPQRFTPQSTFPLPTPKSKEEATKAIDGWLKDFPALRATVMRTQDPERFARETQPTIQSVTRKPEKPTGIGSLLPSFEKQIEPDEVVMIPPKITAPVLM